MRRNLPMLALGTALAATLAACGSSGGAGMPSDVPTDTNRPETQEADRQKRAEEKQRAEEQRKKAEEEPVDENERAREIAEAEGKTVLVGEVRIIDGPDIFDYEDVDAEKMGGKDSEEGNTYAILELDEETHISGVSADGSPRESDDDHICLGRNLPKYDFVEDTVSQWKEYDGKTVCVAGHAWFPTDASLPASARMNDAEVLYAE